jgi:hypothetical protein
MADGLMINQHLLISQNKITSHICNSVSKFAQAQLSVRIVTNARYVLVICTKKTSVPRSATANSEHAHAFRDIYNVTLYDIFPPTSKCLFHTP